MRSSTLLLLVLFSGLILASCGDVPLNSPYYRDVKAVVEEGLMSCEPGGEFRGVDYVTRYELARALSRFLDRYESVLEELDGVDLNFEKVNARLDDLEKRLEDFKTESYKLSESVNYLKERFEKEIYSLKKELSGLKGDLDEQRKDLRELSDALKGFEGLLEDLSKRVESLESLKSEISNLKRDFESSSDEIKSLGRDLGDLSKVVLKNEKEISDLKSKLSLLEKDLSSVNGALSYVKDISVELVRDYNDVLTRVGNLEKAFEKRVDELSSEIQRVETSSSSSMSSLEREMEDLRSGFEKRFGELDEEIRGVESRLKMIEMDWISNLEVRLSKMESSVASKGDLLSLSSTVSDLSDEIESLKSDLTTLKASLDDLLPVKTAVSSLTEDLANEVKEREILSEKLGELESSLDDLRSKCKAEFESMENDLKSRVKIDEHRKLVKEVDELRGSVETLSSSLSSLQDGLKQFHGEIESTGEMIRATNLQIKGLKEEQRKLEGTILTLTIISILALIASAISLLILFTG